MASGPFQSCSFSLGGPKGGIRELGKGERRGSGPRGWCQVSATCGDGGGGRGAAPSAPTPACPTPAHTDCRTQDRAPEEADGVIQPYKGI